jgi:hypothetical protein
MRRRSTLRRKYYTRTTKSNIARNKTKNTPRIKYTFKASKAGELYYIRRRKTYEQPPYYKYYKHRIPSHFKITGRR